MASPSSAFFKLARAGNANKKKTARTGVGPHIKLDCNSSIRKKNLDSFQQSRKKNKNKEFLHNYFKITLGRK